jgi:hypothetical protein
MTHETTVKIGSRKVKLTFCTQAFYNLAQKYGCDIAGVFDKAQKEWMVYYKDIVTEAIRVNPENKIELLEGDAWTWLDSMTLEDAELVSKAHANSRILGKPLMKG